MTDFENILLNNGKKSRVKLKDRLSYVVSHEEDFLKYLNSLDDKGACELLKVVGTRFNSNIYWKQEEENVSKILKHLNYRAGRSTRGLMALSRDYKVLKSRGELDYNLLKSYLEKVDSFETCCLFYNSYWERLRVSNGNIVNSNWRVELVGLKRDIELALSDAYIQINRLGRAYKDFEIMSKKVSKFSDLADLVNLLVEVHDDRRTNYNLVTSEVDRMTITMDNIIMNIAKKMDGVEYRPVSIAQAASEFGYCFKNKVMISLFTPTVDINAGERLIRKRSLTERIKDKFMEKTNNFLGSFCGYSLQPQAAY